MRSPGFSTHMALHNPVRLYLPVTALSSNTVGSIPFPEVITINGDCTKSTGNIQGLDLILDDTETQHLSILT